MRSSNRVILERDKELAALAGAIADAAAGHGTFVLVEGPAGIGKTTLLRAACALASADGPEILTARGLALEGDFPYGIVRQLIEPVLAGATPDDWPGLLDGAAGLAARVFDWAGVASAGDDSPYSTMHGLYWLIANLAARRPLVIAVDDAHWADAPSLRWLAHLAERIEELPVALLLATRTAPDEPALMAGLRACPAIQPFRLSPLSPGSTTVLIREQFATDAAADLCQACHASTGGNPYLLESLAAALRAVDGPRADLAARVGTVGPQQVARSVLRRVGLIGDGACRLARAVAVFGGPVPLRLAAILAGLELGEAARLADSLRAADVLAPGPVLEFAHPIVRTAIYESIPPGERALAHASTARLLDREGAAAERLAPHLLRSEPAGDPRVVALLGDAARAASGRGSPGTAADYLRRALDEPPAPASRPGILLDLGLSLAGERSPDAAVALQDAVRLTTRPAEHATAALLSASVLGLWGHHATVMDICLDALTAGDTLDPGTRDNLEAELFANALTEPSAIRKTLARAGCRVADPGGSGRWRVNAAFTSVFTAQPVGDALDWLDPVLAAGLGDIAPDSLAAAYVLLTLILADELDAAGNICDTVLDEARKRGSMSMVAHASCSRSMLMRRLGQLDDAADDAQLALGFKLATSPPVAVAWAAAFSIDALTCLGRFADADQVASVTARRAPPEGWVQTVMFRQARGGSGPPSNVTGKRCAISPRPGKAGRPSASPARRSRPGGPTPRPCTPRAATRRPRPRWPASSWRSPGGSAPRGPSASRCAPAPRLSLIRPVKTWLKRSVCWNPRRPGTTWPRSSATWVRTCAGQAIPGTRGPRCSAPRISRGARARRPWPSGPGRSCWPPAPGRGAPRSPVLTRSPAPNGGWPDWPRTACPTGRSPSTCSSRRPPSKPTSGTPSRNSG